MSIPKSDYSYFTSNFNAVFAKLSSLWIIDGPWQIFLFNFERDPNSKISHI